MIEDVAGPGTVLPPSRCRCSTTRPCGEVPVYKILGDQAQGKLQWPGVPYGADIDKVFGAAFDNLSKGTWTPKQSKDETVKAIKDLITKYP